MSAVLIGLSEAELRKYYIQEYSRLCRLNPRFDKRHPYPMSVNQYVEKRMSEHKGKGVSDA